MSLVQIKVLYNYYSTKRVTPVYILHEELENFSFEEFKSRMTKDVPHLCKATSLRWTVEDDYGCRNVSIFDVMYMYLNTPYIDNNTVIYMSFC